MSSFLRLNGSDFAKGLAVAVLAAVLSYLAQQFNLPGFDFYGINWQEVLRIAVAAGGAYLVKNLLTTQDGKFGGFLEV
jgi:hypothetical protein